MAGGIWKKDKYIKKNNLEGFQFVGLKFDKYLLKIRSVTAQSPQRNQLPSLTGTPFSNGN